MAFVEMADLISHSLHRVSYIVIVNGGELSSRSKAGQQDEHLAPSRPCSSSVPGEKEYLASAPNPGFGTVLAELSLSWPSKGW
jgi:hypothetical protein